MSETVWEWLRPKLPVILPSGIGHRPLAWTIAKEAGLLDARIYGVCKTCGGSRTRLQGHVDVEGEGLEDTIEPCPDCDTISIVTSEVREKAGLALAARDEFVDDEQRQYHLGYVDAVLEAVLPEIEIVDEVAHVCEAGNFACRDSEERYDVLPLHRGDIIYIKRKQD